MYTTCLHQSQFIVRRLNSPWIEFDLSEITLVSGVITQGFTAVIFPLYVTQYKVKYQKLPGPSSLSDYVTDDKGDIQVRTRVSS